MGLEPVGPVGDLGAALALAETQELHGALLDVRLQRGLRLYPVADVLWRRRIPFCFLTANCDERMNAYPAESRPLQTNLPAGLTCGDQLAA